MSTAVPERDPTERRMIEVRRDLLLKAALNVARVVLVSATVLSFFVLWSFNPSAGRSLFVLLPILALASFASARAALIPWSVYILGFLVFVDLRMISAEILFPAQYDYVIGLTRLLFAGHIDVVVLQSWLYTPESPGILDTLLIGVHISFFIVPHLTAVLLWVVKRELFRRYVFALVATCWFALLVAFVLPTAPPWLAGVEGRIEPVHRVMQEVMSLRAGIDYDAGVRIVGENDVAAMPSLHTALTVLVALAVGRFGRISRLFGWLYAGAMMFALVYLGEHYIVDVAAGIASACLFWYAFRWSEAGAGKGKPRADVSQAPHPSRSSIPDPASQIAE